MPAYYDESMKKNTFAYAIGLLLLVVAGVLSLQLNQPPTAKKRSSPADEFSAARAFDHLKILAAHPRSAGSSFHDSARLYIFNYCQQAGLQTEIQDTVVFRMARNGQGIIGGRVRNIIATLKGTGNKNQQVLVMAHYDTEPNTPGATDDGAGVVAMLETIRALRASSPLLHDVTFLFTDLEEAGLLGAEAYVTLFPIRYENTVVLNYESRGNRGAALAFEVSEQNGWMVRQFSQGAPHPLLNSLTYEIYKHLPNDTDFTPFRKKGYTGINQANIGGHVNYHSMTDTPERADLRLIQHHGDNMLGMIRHLDTQDLSTTRLPDVTYFNPAGYWLWIYPSFLNLPLIIVCGVLFISFVYMAGKKERIRIWKVVLVAVVFIVTLLVSLAMGWAATKLILSLYPHYANFYHHDFYNSGNYLFVYVGLTVMVFALVPAWILRSINTFETITGIAFVLLALLLPLYAYLPSGSFLIYYPLGLYLLVNTGGILLRDYADRQIFLLTLSIFPAILLILPVAHMVYITFTLDLPYGTMLLTGILLALALPLLINLKRPLVVSLFALVCVLGGFLFAHRHSAPSSATPLRVSLSYFLDADTGKAYWFSADQYQAPWLSNFVDAHSDSVILNPPSVGASWLTGPAPFNKLPASTVEHSVDTLATGEHVRTLLIKPQRGVVSFRVFVEGAEGTLIVNQQDINWKVTRTPPHFILFRPIGPEGLTLSFTSAINEPLNILIIERSYGIPEEWLHVKKPEEVIWSTGDYGNAVFVKQTVRL